MNESTQEIIDRVDNASLKELRDVDIEDVYIQMDETLKARPTPLDLYFRWERQNWSTQDLDFSEDRAHWDSMVGFFEGMRTELQRTFTLFFLGEQAVTDTLSPLVHAAPDEDSRNFLSTQLVDEARHSIFFSRFFSEVVGIEGGIHAALEQLRDRTVHGYRELFDTELVQATEAVREAPSDYAAWVRGVATYHLVIEGMLALTGQRYLLGIVREMGILPGFYAGFTAVARDESRHVNFGVRALMEAGVRDRSHLEVVADQIFRLLPMACRIVAAPDRRFAIAPADTPPNLHINPYDVREFSLNSLIKRLKVIGIPQATLEEIRSRGLAYYDAAWTEYEEIHGEDHPYRYFDQMAASGS